MADPSARTRASQPHAAAALAVLVVCAVLGAAGPAGADQIAIQQVEALRYRAMVTGDLETLDRLLADDLVYTHSHGGVDDKESFLAALADGSVDYKRLAVDSVRIQVWNDAAVVTGGVEMVVAAGGKEHDLSSRFTAVYRFAGDRWQLAAWQSTRREEK
jgi:uncharacterized protein (TIGR02246 family)